MSNSNQNTSLQQTPLEHFNERLDERLKRNREREAMCLAIWQFARSAERHLDRIEPAAHRYQRALLLRQREAAAYEKHVMLALLYEAIDTVLVVIQQLDWDTLELELSADGSGLVGEDAQFLVELMQVLERICSRALSIAKLHELQLDFSTPVDELEGITYYHHAHWSDFVPGSLEKSFMTYFGLAKQGVTARLNQAAKFSGKMTYRQALAKSKRPALREIIRRLEAASFSAMSLTGRIQKEVQAGRPSDRGSRTLHAILNHLHGRESHR
jgi:hypothetical protein